MHQKVDDEVVFVCGADFLFAGRLQACECLRFGPDYSEEVTFRGSCGQPAVIAVT